MTQPHDEVEHGPSRPGVDAYLDQVRSMIRDHGWAIQGVFATETSDQRWDFAYTVGLMERGCTAELVMTGIPMNTAAVILNEIAAAIVNSGEKIPPAEYPLPGGYVLKAVAFTPRQGSDIHLGVARAYYDRPDVPVVQYVWPDKEHRYPWDDGWDPELLQPYGIHA